MSNIVCEANVQRYYADDPAQLAKYAETLKSGRCPFCEPNITSKFLGETDCYNIVYNQFPYKYADKTLVRLHLLVLPKRHIIRIGEMTPGEWADMFYVTQLVETEYPFLKLGYGEAVRSDEVGGVTIYHLHWHIIAPQIGQTGQKPVNFGIG